MRHEVAAAHDGNRIEYADEHRVHRVERSHEPVRQLLGVDESMVALVELADLDALVSERFHHADATERILEPCVDIGHLLAVLGEYRPLAVVPPERVGRHEHGGDEHDERERHVDEEQKRERARDLEDADEEVLGAVVGELGYVEQVGNELAHHGAGVVAVVVGEAQALVLLEQILAHVGLHARAHDVAPARDEVLARRTDGVHDREQNRDEPERRDDDVGRLEEELLGEEVQYLGKRQIHDRKHRSAEQIEDQKRPIGPVIRNERPHHFGGAHGRLVCFFAWTHRILASPSFGRRAARLSFRT